MRRQTLQPSGWLLPPVMPSVWSWYQIALARWSFGYWKTPKPGRQVTQYLLFAFAAKKSYQVPTVA